MVVWSIMRGVVVGIFEGGFMVEVALCRLGEYVPSAGFIWGDRQG